MSSTGPSNVERYAYEVVRRALQVGVDHHDTGAGEGMVDAIIRFPDGRSGVLEVTTIGDPE